jgi:tetratricopeptide (TPR) repeat protein
MPVATPETNTQSRLFFPETWPAIARAAVLLGVAVLLAYHNTLFAPFVFEDLPAIARNSSIRTLWPPAEVLLPGKLAGHGVAPWPLVNFSFALNYAAGGLNVTGYHVVNILIHGAAAVLLFAVVRRTLELPQLKQRFGPSAFPMALAVALIWALHPLQTASVTSVVQRAEVMVGMFFLLLLHAFIRAAQDDARSGWWKAVAVVASLAGMASGAMMLAGPLIVFLYDRTFISGSWREAARRHGKLHLAIAMTWLLGIGLLVRIGLGVGAAPVENSSGSLRWLSQGAAPMKYLALSFWPKPLVFDYGWQWDVARTVTAMVPYLAGAGILIGATVWALVRRPVLGFLATWFLLSLAPGAFSISETPVAEHRVYLALVSVIAVTVGFVGTTFGRSGMVVLFGLAALCGGLTVKRNFDYESAVVLWRDTVAKVPENPRAHFNLANALSAAGRSADAITHYQSALRLAPRYAVAHFNLGGVLMQLGRFAEAVVHFRGALQHGDGLVDVHLNLAAALVRLGRTTEAVAHYEIAARHGLLAKEEQLRFGRALAEAGRIDEALVRLLEAARLHPNHAETRVVTGMVLSAAGRTAEALQHFTAAVVADPNDAEARGALGDLLIESNRPSEALVHYEAALKLQPGQAAIYHVGMGNALIRLGRAEEAVSHYESALQLNPDNQEASAGLRIVRGAMQRRGLLKN